MESIVFRPYCVKHRNSGWQQMKYLSYDFKEYPTDTCLAKSAAQTKWNVIASA